MARRLMTCLLLVCFGVSASVVRIQVTGRSDILDGRSFGSAGPYEKIAAKAYFEVDPRLPVNRIITDIDLAPVNSHGKVEFSADLYVLKPRDPDTVYGWLDLYEQDGIVGLIVRQHGGPRGRPV